MSLEIPLSPLPVDAGSFSGVSPVAGAGLFGRLPGLLLRGFVPGLRFPAESFYVWFSHSFTVSPCGLSRKPWRYYVV